MTSFAVVTVIHDSAPDLERLLDSIERELDPAPTIVVVDSGSRDGGAQVARERGARLLELDGNRGFGAGCNAGLAMVEEPVTALVNPDVELLDDGLARLAEEAAAREALIAPRLLNVDGSVQDSAHPLPGRLEGLVPALLPRPLLPGPLRRRYEPWRSERPRAVGWATAACLVAQTGLLRRLGPFDADAFLFYEDMDLCLRARDAGVPTLLRPEIALRHRGGTSTGPALGDANLPLRARRRREVVAREGRRALLLDDLAEAATFATRGAARRVTGHDGEVEGARLRALREARRANREQTAGRLRPVRHAGRGALPGTLVAIDARAAVRREIGGVERLAREMAVRLPALRSDRYVALRPRPWLAHRAGHAWEQLALPLVARRAALIYCPANLAPVASRRNVVVIHDLAALAHPEWYGRTYVAWQRLVLPLVARRARLVITVSRFSRDEIAERLHVPAESIAVVPNGVSEAFSPTADPAPARAALGLERPYVLALATLSARKNLAVLVPAAGALAEQGIELVVAGGDRGYLRDGPPPPGRSLGYVPDPLLPGLYAGALAFAMPSLYEGFGLPCLEAMASGTPVVAADRAALPETCGGAALLADPGDPDGFAAALLRAAGPERDRLRAAGLERARAFTWERTAELADRAIGELLP